MNRRFFLKLLPVASAAVALPAMAASADKKPQSKASAPLPAKWQGDGDYEVKIGHDIRVLSVVRWSAFDDINDGRCFRFSPRIPSARGEIVYRYEAAMEAVLVRKVEAMHWRVPV